MTQPPPPPSSPGPEPGDEQPPGAPPYGQGYEQAYGQVYGQPPSPPYAPGPYGQVPYGQTPHGQTPHGQRPPSKALGGWALGLAIAFCVPLATFVSIGLAIAALLQSRDGRDHGKGMAIAALVIDGLLIVGLAALLAVGLVLGSVDEPRRDSQGQVTERDAISTLDVRAGDCLDDPALMAAGEEEVEVKEAQAVPCDEPHDLEAYLVFELDGEAYPGSRQVTRRAAVGCLRGFEEFVGRNYRSSELEFWSYYPQERTWDLLDDRAVVCLVGTPDEKTSGSLEDSGR